MFFLRDALSFHVRRMLDPTITQEENMLIDVLHTSPNDLFATYSTYLNAHPERLSSCHGILHRIGHEAFEHVGFDEAMRLSHPLCGGGYIHGVIQAKFGAMTVLRPSRIQSDIIEACGDSRNELCFHGIGHGLMVLYRNDISRSLHACKGADLPGRIDCYDGVFMHVFDAEETGVLKDIPERSLGFKLCDSVERDMQPSCQFYAPRIFAHEASMTAKAVSACQAVSAIDDARVCALGTGHMFMKYLLPNTERALDACSLFASATLRRECDTGVGMYRTLQDTTNWQS